MNILKTLTLSCLIFMHHPIDAARRERSCTLSMVGLVYLTVFGSGSLLIDIAPNVPDVFTSSNTSFVPHAPAQPQNLLKKRLAGITKKVNVASKKESSLQEYLTMRTSLRKAVREKARSRKQFPQNACLKYQQARNSLGYEECMQGYADFCNLENRKPLTTTLGKDWWQGYQESQYHARTSDQATREQHTQSCKILTAKAVTK